MRRSVFLAGTLALLPAFSCFAPSATPGNLQEPSTPQGQPQNAKPTSTQPAPVPADLKKSKKVWTNENLSDASGTVSVVGNAKAGTKTTSRPSKPADPKYVADTRKQLAKLQGEISDLDKQINQLKNFSEGEPAASSGATKINKSYNRDPVPVQIQELEDKIKQTQDQIDTLLDEARKKGVEPGQLR